MLKIITMTVNGKETELAVDDREALLDTLRNRLGLNSVKRGCEVGECGACTVLVDGEAIDSCIYLTMWAEGKHIMTVEGLKGKNGELSPIQKAFVEEAAVQCGFCTPGLIMSAVEIVGTGKRYSREELKKLISGHLCRCTGYENILNAMERIVEETYRTVNREKQNKNRSAGHVCAPAACPVFYAFLCLYPSGKIDFFLMESLSVLGRCDAFIALKQFHKIFFIRKSTHICDPVDRQCPVGEQVFGNSDPCPIYIGEDGITGVFLENIGQIGGMIPKLFCY